MELLITNRTDPSDRKEVKSSNVFHAYVVALMHLRGNGTIHIHRAARQRFIFSFLHNFWFSAVSFM